MSDAVLAKLSLVINSDGYIMIEKGFVDNESLRKEVDLWAPQFQYTDELVEMVDYVKGKLEDLHDDINKRYLK